VARSYRNHSARQNHPWPFPFHPIDYEGDTIHHVFTTVMASRDNPLSRWIRNAAVPGHEVLKNLSYRMLLGSRRRITREFQLVETLICTADWDWSGPVFKSSCWWRFNLLDLLCVRELHPRVILDLVRSQHSPTPPGHHAVDQDMACSE
jgi:hypothetical protein